jgi:protein-S-isoprenylcysteine O-methyltransferase Ste14
MFDLDRLVEGNPSQVVSRPRENLAKKPRRLLSGLLMIAVKFVIDGAINEYCPGKFIALEWWVYNWTPCTFAIIALIYHDTMPTYHYLLVFALLFIYFALHSVLAADRVKTWFADRLGSHFRFYRLMYNVVAAVLLLLLLRWMFGRPAGFLFEKNVWTYGVAFVLLAPGAWLGLASLRQYDLGEFTGTQQMKRKIATPDHSTLNTSGVNALVRHPLYLATLLILAGFFFVYPKISALVLLASVLLYLPFGIYYEEKKLRLQFGQAYLDYEKQVKRLIPGVW